MPKKDCLSDLRPCLLFTTLSLFCLRQAVCKSETFLEELNLCPNLLLSESCCGVQFRTWSEVLRNVWEQAFLAPSCLTPHVEGESTGEIHVHQEEAYRTLQSIHHPDFYERYCKKSTYKLKRYSSDSKIQNFQLMSHCECTYNISQMVYYDYTGVKFLLIYLYICYFSNYTLQ